MFRNIERAMGKTTPVRAVDLELIREYQQERRKQISPTMKKAVSARTVNYELQLLRGVMRYAGCWKGEIAECYRALSERKSDVGRAATKEQLVKIIAKAQENEYWKVAMYCAAVAAGSACVAGRSSICSSAIFDSQMAMSGSVTRSQRTRQGRESRLMALTEWGLRELLYRARQLGATEPEHYLLPLNLRKSRHCSKKTKQK
jgi:hypothetical protein